MFDVRRQEDHYHESREWLDTDWHFSFGSYRDPDNTHFGPLRVVNHDLVAGGGGWGMHSHRDMEIVTWVVEGELAHEDSTGSRGTIGEHEVQAMSAGTGISHSEYNASDTESVRLLQIWIEPSENGGDPSYDEASFDADDLRNEFVPVASGHVSEGVPVRRDASVLVALPESGAELDRSLDSGRKYYGINVTGTVDWNDETLQQGDAVRIADENDLRFRAREDAEVLLMDLPASR